MQLHSNYKSVLPIFFVLFLKGFEKFKSLFRKSAIKNGGSANIAMAEASSRGPL